MDKKTNLRIVKVEFVPTKGVEKKLAPIWVTLLKSTGDENARCKWKPPTKS